MKGKIYRDLIILVGVFGLVWLGFSLFSYPEDPKLVSIDQEEKLGEHYLDLILKSPEFEPMENDRVDSLIQLMSDRLIPGLVDSEFNYSFTVFDNEMVNAFTIPGGNILISTGLILFCDTPEELASVICHEMGHVEKRHVISRLVKEVGLEILTSGDTFVLGEVTSMITSSGFDRRQEQEADLFAQELLESCHIEPRTLATLFRKLEQEMGNELLEHFEIVSTHPNFSSRIREALSYSPADDFEVLPFELDWDALQGELK